MFRAATLGGRAMKYQALAIVLALSAACPAAAKETTPLAPSGDWTLDYANDSCALRRSFGEGENRTLLEFRRFAPGATLQTLVATSNTKPKRRIEVEYRLGSEGEWSEAGAGLAVSLGNGFKGVIFRHSLFELPELDEIEDPIERDARLMELDWRSIEKEAAAGIETIALRRAFPKEIALQLGSLSKPIVALNECVDELTTHWNIDVEAHKTLTRRAVPINFAEVPSMMDYPPKMIQQHMPGIVNVRLAIDVAGRISACHIQMPLSDPEFEESSCADVQHALEFEPALDKDGKPIASYWVTTVIFELRGP